MEHSKHIFRVAILVILVLVAFHIVRTLFTPGSFGRYGRYRADNVVEQMERPVRHGESASCSQCHDEKMAQLREGSHSTVQCESCHAPLPTHIKDNEKIAPMPQNRSFAFCLRCHERLEARPSGFPQIDVQEHLQKASMEMSPDVCVSCHDPHSPEIGG